MSDMTSRLLMFWRNLNAATLLAARQGRGWLAKNWPPFRDRLLAGAEQTRVWLIKLTRLAGLLAVRIGRAIVDFSRRVYDLTRALYGYLRQQIRRYWPPIRQRLLLYAELTRLNRPIGILLLLWPTLWALWSAAEGIPSLDVLVVFVIGVVLTRSAGCVLNDMADHKFDAYVRRTMSRPLATRRIDSFEALLLACLLLLIAFLLVLTMNRLTVLLSFVAIPLAVIYPFMKRYTYIPQFFLGLAFGWGIPMAFAAQTGTVPPIAWLLFAANIVWSVIYDTIYAMVDREDDLKAGVKSTAILFDDADRTIIGILQLMFLAAMVLVGIQIKAEMLYYACLGPVVLLMVYHQYLIRHRVPEACFKAFLNNHWVGMILFVGIYLNYI